MVKLVVDNLDQITILEYLLFTNGVKHEIVLNDGRFGMSSPYLLVYGVPLDESRAIKWIIGQGKDDYYCE